MMDEEIEEIEDNYDTDQEYMTTVIAIRSKNGIIMASDSQSTLLYTKNLGVDKIFKINNSLCIGAAGKESHIKVLVEKLKQELKDKEFDSEPNLRKQLDNILIDLYKTYNVERSVKLGYKETKLHFNPQALIAAKLQNNGFCLYFAYFNETTSWITLIDNDYMSIGSGSTIANFVLMQQSRPFVQNNMKLYDVGLEQKIWIAAIVINEVKNIDVHSGGSTKVVLMYNKGYRELKNEEQQQLFQSIKNKTPTMISQLVNDANGNSIIKNMLNTFFPQ